jgi:hypothetical protein
LNPVLCGRDCIGLGADAPPREDDSLALRPEDVAGREERIDVLAVVAGEEALVLGRPGIDLLATVAGK